MHNIIWQFSTLPRTSTNRDCIRPSYGFQIRPYSPSGQQPTLSLWYNITMHQTTSKHTEPTLVDASESDAIISMISSIWRSTTRWLICWRKSWTTRTTRPQWQTLGVPPPLPLIILFVFTVNFYMIHDEENYIEDRSWKSRLNIWTILIINLLISKRRANWFLLVHVYL